LTPLSLFPAFPFSFITFVYLLFLCSIAVRWTSFDSVSELAVAAPEVAGICQAREYNLLLSLGPLFWELRFRHICTQSSYRSEQNVQQILRNKISQAQLLYFERDELP
jgi:hypothetical protein